MKIKTAIIAHRGASAYAPENTLAAFQKAYEMGADGIEIDVLFSKDGHIMVHHDFHLGRCEQGAGMVRDHNYFDLRKLDAGSWFGKEYEGQKIPSIEEVLQFIKDRNMILNIEIKTGSPYDAGIEKELLKVVKKYDMCDRIIFSSFNHLSLVYIKKLHGDARIAALTACAMVNPWEYLKLHDFNGYHPNQLAISDKIIEKLIKKNIFVNPYTVNNVDTMKRFMLDNVSGIITDVPDIAVRVRNEITG